jgi:hypothetical protein
MAFTGGIKRPQQSQASGSNQQNTYDRLITVTGYDIPKGYIYGKDEAGKEYEVYVNQAEFQRSEQALTAKGQDRTKINWMGHAIDKGMEKNVPVGSKVVLIRSKVISTDKTRGLAVTEVHRIGGVPNNEADKTFQGILSMTYRMDEGAERISRVQHWNPKGIDVNDEEGVGALHEKIEIARKNYGVKIGEHPVTEPTIGIQFRALMKTDKEYAFAKAGEPKGVYEVVDTSQPFDWMPGPVGDDGKEIKTGAHPLTGDEMIAFAEQYLAYISEKPQFKDNIDDMTVEICFYHAYPASKNDFLRLTTGDKAKDKNADKNPLHQLSHRKSYGDLEHTDDGLIIGRVAAVNGIIQISPNKLDKVNGKPVEIPSYWVNKVHANNTRGHVHSFIRTASGAKAEPHPQLKFLQTEQTNTANAAPAQTPDQEPKPANVNQSTTAAPVSAEAFDPFEGGTQEGFDPFSDAPAEGTAEASNRPRLGFGSRKV